MKEGASHRIIRLKANRSSFSGYEVPEPMRNSQRGRSGIGQGLQKAAPHRCHAKLTGQ